MVTVQTFGPQTQTELSKTSPSIIQAITSFVDSLRGKPGSFAHFGRH